MPVESIPISGARGLGIASFVSPHIDRVVEFLKLQYGCSYYEINVCDMRRVGGCRRNVFGREIE